VFAKERPHFGQFLIASNPFCSIFLTGNPSAGSSLLFPYDIFRDSNRACRHFRAERRKQMIVPGVLNTFPDTDIAARQITCAPPSASQQVNDPKPMGISRRLTDQGYFRKHHKKPYIDHCRWEDHT